MTLENLLNQVKTAPTQVEFAQVMDVINNHYNYTPSQFSNGDLTNLAGTNEGSCKIFYFAKLNQLTEAQTLHLFGTYYRDDVLKHPEGSDHGNIRNFMKTGWDGVDFEDTALEIESN
ncbi:HopJ type III effector protein [Paraglaciecola marina]|uniref:HopJ type III effector protein n=1 Tax=Paraglaciecola marina TaxID=2500157 RepID=UPI00105CF62F|nr:HopJ type III effector protein [Paraglaciecola marina]